MTDLVELAGTVSQSSAVISECGLYRYRLDRGVQECGLVAAFFGVNGSTAGPIEEDHTTLKWHGFSLRNSFRRYIAGNPFAYRARDVKRLATVPDPVGPENARYLAEIIAEADVLIPCWGRRDKVPRSLRYHFDALKERLFAAGKPVLIFGLTDGGDPKHPLMLGYDTPLVPWSRPCRTIERRTGMTDLDPLKYEFFTPCHRGFDLVFDFLCSRPDGRFGRKPWSITASYGYERARDTRVCAEEQPVGTAHELWERFAPLAPAYQRFMREVETAATQWAAEKQAADEAEALRHEREEAALCERILAAETQSESKQS